MISFMLKHIWLAAFLVSACTTSPAFIIEDDDEEELPRYDTESLPSDGRHWLLVEANGPFEFDYHVSNSVDDVNCEGPSLYGPGRNVDAEIPKKVMLDFRRQGSPTRALYEWHICFVIDDVVYRAWRGFDPGPDTELQISCFIDQEQIENKDTSKYLCETKRVTQFFGNYTEYGVHCWGEDRCKSFDTKEDLEKWTSLNPLSRDELVQIATAILEHQLSNDSYIFANKMDYYLSIEGEDPPQELLQKFSTNGWRFHPASEYESDGDILVTVGNKMSMSIAEFEQVEKGVAEGRYGTRCGTLCASGHTVIVEKVEGKWKIKSIEMYIIS